MEVEVIEITRKIVKVHTDKPTLKPVEVSNLKETTKATVYFHMKVGTLTCTTNGLIVDDDKLKNWSPGT